MTNATPLHDPIEVQRARAAHLRSLFEPWSIRKLATRTGLSKSVVASRLSGETPLNQPEFEVLAPVIRMTPMELFEELLSVDPDRKLPDMDSNHEPIGSTLHELIYLEDAREKKAATHSIKDGNGELG